MMTPRLQSTGEPLFSALTWLADLHSPSLRVIGKQDLLLRPFTGSLSGPYPVAFDQLRKALRLDNIILERKLGALSVTSADTTKREPPNRFFAAIAGCYDGSLQVDRSGDSVYYIGDSLEISLLRAAVRPCDHSTLTCSVSIRSQYWRKDTTLDVGLDWASTPFDLPTLYAFGRGSKMVGVDSSLYTMRSGDSITLASYSLAERETTTRDQSGLLVTTKSDLRRGNTISASLLDTALHIRHIVEDDQRGAERSLVVYDSSMVRSGYWRKSQSSSGLPIFSRLPVFRLFFARHAETWTAFGEVYNISLKCP